MVATNAYATGATPMFVRSGESIMDYLSKTIKKIIQVRKSEISVG